MERSISILIAEDHATVRGAVKLLLEQEPDFSVVAEAGNGEDAVRFTKSLKPDLVLMDISMPDLDGSRATRRIKNQLPNTKVLVLSRHDDDGYIKKLLAEGADGYVLKQSSSTVLLEAIRQVCQGSGFLDPSITKAVLNDLIPASPDFRSDTLSPREISVIQYVAHGFSIKEVADRLDLSPKTIENIKSGVTRKLGFSSRVDLVRYAIKQGWLKDN